MQEQVSKICKEQLTPALDKLFDRLVSTDEIIAIEKIEIDLGELEPRNLERELVEKIIRELEKQIPIQLLPDAKGTTKIPVQQNHFQMWLEYLERGTLPWQASQLDEKKWRESVLSNVSANVTSKERLKLVLQKNPLAIRRLIFQYPSSFLEKLIKASKAKVRLNISKVYDELEVAIFSFTKKDWMSVERKLTKNQFFQKATFRQIFWKEMINQFLIQDKASGKSEEILENIFSKIISKKEMPQFVNVLLRKADEQISNSSLEIKPILKTLQRELSKTPSIEKEKRVLPIRKSKKESSDEKSLKQRKSISNKNSPNAEKENTPSEKIDQFKKQKNSTERNPQEEELFEENILNQDATKDLTEIDFEKIPEGTAYYIAHAGVVMTHPFLSRFFQKLNLLEDSKFKDETARQRAIHLLHFLASGNTQIPEYELLLPKFLCGLPFEIPIERDVTLTDEEKAECGNLLQTMITHWGALGNTTPDGLREGFLQRTGKLEKRQNGWYLLVEGKTIDMLLDRLPWNLSMIQLSWMKELLRVEWY